MAPQGGKKKSKKKSPKKLSSTARETMNYNHGLALIRAVLTSKQKYVKYQEKMDNVMKDFQAKERTLLKLLEDHPHVGVKLWAVKVGVSPLGQATSGALFVIALPCTVREVVGARSDHQKLHS
eukprot:COSAG01_NODE_17065_length_1181_cov_2.353974_1_plen_123_part_00